MNVFLELPAEIIGAVVGSWLELHEIAKLDSAFCHAQQRAVFLDSILQSPRCLVADVADRFGLFQASDIGLKWLALKKVRMEVVRFSRHSDLTIWEPYLRTFGQCVKCARFEYMYSEPNSSPSLVAKYCVNLTSLIWTDREFTEELVHLFYSCTKLATLVVQSSSINQYLGVESVPSTHHLRLKSIDITYPAGIEEMIFKVSAPASVQKLRVNNINAPDWRQFVNLRSLGFYTYISAEDEPQLLHILQHCPLIVNLDVSNLDLLTDEVVGNISRSLRQLRTLNIEYSSRVTDRALMEITSHHNQTLEALYTKTCDKLTVAGINHVLKECPHLHTISYNSFSGVDYSLMGNITTLLLGKPVDASGWEEMRLHCRSVQYLHIAFDYDYYRYHSVVDEVVNTVCGLPKLRTLYVIDLPSEQYKQIVAEVGVRRRTVRVTDTEDESEWYKLFDMPI